MSEGQKMEAAWVMESIKLYLDSRQLNMVNIIYVNKRLYPCVFFGGSGRKL